ncbi:MAG: lysozyme [Alphaproteobacteria bacterium]|nr:lysozyme [Alphaproteobacteria bacterium]
MEVSKEGLALIRRFEGFRAKAYRCPAGIWTIGYGHTSQAGPPTVTPGMQINRDDASDILDRDVARFAEDVRKLVRVDLSDAQFAALVSFAFNVGIGNFRASSVLKAVNAGEFDIVPRRLQLWVKAGSKILPGLVKRRAAEAELFIGGEGSAETAASRSVQPAQGKPLRKSTTVLAAIISSLAAIGSAISAGAASGGWIALLGLAICVGASFWIIRERRRRALEEGL